MREEFMPVPTLETWRRVADEYEQRWNFTHCLGSIDRKHVCIQKPLKSGSEFYCYKEFFSIVLMAAVDANYKFIFIDAGIQGRFSDGFTFGETALYKNLKNSYLDLPEDSPLPSCSNPPMPYVFVADAAFPLQKHYETTV